MIQPKFVCHSINGGLDHILRKASLSTMKFQLHPNQRVVLSESSFLLPQSNSQHHAEEASIFQLRRCDTLKAQAPHQGVSPAEECMAAQWSRYLLSHLSSRLLHVLSSEFENLYKQSASHHLALLRDGEHEHHQQDANHEDDDVPLPRRLPPTEKTLSFFEAQFHSNSQPPFPKRSRQHLQRTSPTPDHR